MTARARWRPSVRAWIASMKTEVAKRSRDNRARLFNEIFKPTPETRIVDLGGGKGRHFARHFPALRNVVIADYNADALAYAREIHGFETRLIDGSQGMDFAPGEFDIVFCSSVIEHVTGQKDDAVWRFKTDSAAFRREAVVYQAAFAAEIARAGRGYWVQTPNRWFPVEVHSWLPFLGWMPSTWQWAILQVTNSFWPRKDEAPDWSLLGRREMQRLFPDAQILAERWGPFVKSWIAVRA